LICGDHKFVEESDDKGFIWVGDAPTSGILKFDLNGNFLYGWGAPGPQPAG